MEEEGGHTTLLKTAAQQYLGCLMTLGGLGEGGQNALFMRPVKLFRIPGGGSECLMLDDTWQGMVGTLY